MIVRSHADPAPKTRAVARVAAWSCLAAAAALASSPGSADDAWVEIAAETLVLVSNVHAQRASEMARELEAFRHVLEEELPQLSPPPRPVTIYAFDSRRTLRRFYPEAPRTVGGIFKMGRDRDVVLLDAGTRVRQQHAYHEYVHFRLRGSVTGTPAWLAEGLAYYYQTFRAAEGGYEVGATVPGLGTRAGTSVTVLLEPGRSPPRDSKAFARQAWRLVHYLQSLESGRTAVAKLLETGAGVDLPEFLGASPPEIEAAVARHAADGLLRPRQVKHGPETTPDPPIARVLDEPDRLVRMGELMEVLGSSARGAGESFEQAVRLSPKNPRALLGLARYRLAAGDLDGAATRASEALAADPESPDAYLVRGRIAMARFAAWRTDRPDGATQVLHPEVVKAREDFQHALKLAPRLSEAVRAFARTYLFDPATRQPGIDACREVLEKRDDVDIALTLVELHSDDANHDAAHRVRARHLLRWGPELSVHDATAWTEIEESLARYDMLLAERLWESGRQDRAVDVLADTRTWAPGSIRTLVEALIADLRARAAPPTRSPS